MILFKCTINVRQVLEAILKYYITKYAPSYFNESSHDKIDKLADLNVIPMHFKHKVHEIRMDGNKGAHLDGQSVITPKELESIKDNLETLVKMYIED